jgi:nitroreductase
MDFHDVVSTAWTNRHFTTDPVPDEVLGGAFDAARFAPQGGNRQPVRFVTVREQAKRTQLKDWYLKPWKAYIAAAAEGGVRIGGGDKTALLLERADNFAEHLDEIPVHVVVCAELDGLHPTDLESGRLPIVGGGSVYPAVQNFLLGCRNEGLGAALTTLLCHFEMEVKELLAIPDGVITAAMIPVGWPAKGFPKTLMRRPLSDIVFNETWGNAAFG